MQALAIRSARPPRITVTPRAARLAVGRDGSVDRRKLLPLMRRGRALYFVVRPGDTTKSVLRFFGKLGAPTVYAAARQLVAANRNKRFSKRGAFEEFNRLKPGELLLVPPLWVAPRGSTLRGTLSGLLGEGEDIDSSDVPPGDSGDESDWTDWFGGGGDWSNPDQGDNPQTPPDVGNMTVDEAGNKFGVFCDAGFHREWAWSFPFVECVADTAGQVCEFVGTENGESWWYKGVKDRDGNCTNPVKDRKYDGNDTSGGGGSSDKMAGCGTEVAPGKWTGAVQTNGECLPVDSSLTWKGSGLVFDVASQQVVQYSGGTKNTGGGTTNTGGGGKKNTGGTTNTGGGGKKNTGGTTNTNTNTNTNTGPAPAGLMATLTSPTAKKVYVALGVALALSIALGKKKKGSRRR